MCNRYRLTHSKQYLAERFHALDDEVEEHPRYNIAPTQPVLIVRKEQGKKIRHFTAMRWGLIPSWAKDMSIGNRTLNARSETVTATPHFGIRSLPNVASFLQMDSTSGANGIGEAVLLLRGGRG